MIAPRVPPLRAMLVLLLLMATAASGQKAGGYCGCCGCLEVDGVTYYAALGPDDGRCGEGCPMVKEGYDEICVCSAPINVTSATTEQSRACDEHGTTHTNSKYNLPEGCAVPDEYPTPQDWIPLLKDPRKYLNHPGPRSGETPEHVAIVGAGMAGLTLAWVLVQLGMSVTILESSDRHGGRAYTHYGDGWYGDLGAMRFPPESQQPLTHHIIKQFGCKLHTFTNTGEGQASYINVNGKYFSAEEYENDNQYVLAEIYNIFGIDTNVDKGVFPRNETGHLVSPTSTKVLNNPNIAEACLLDDSVERYQATQLKKNKNIPKEVAQKLQKLWNVIELQRAMSPRSLYQFIQDSPKVHEDTCHHNGIAGSTFMEIENGTSMLPNNIVKSIKKSIKAQNGNKFNIQYNKRVQSINWNKEDIDGVIDGVTLTFQNTLQKPQTFDRVFMTPTAREVSRIKFSPKLPYKQTYALDSFTYMNSVKIFVAFHEPFWAFKSITIKDMTFKNKAPIIPFNKTCSNTKLCNGGSGVTDLPIRVTYYPSHAYHGNALLASYNWGTDADLLTSIPDEKLIQLALDNLAEIHGPVVFESYKEGKVMKWLENDNYSGAIPWAYPGGKQTLVPAFFQQNWCKPGCNCALSFAGEYTSKRDHGWIQAAVESACRVANQTYNGLNKCDAPPEWQASRIITGGIDLARGAYPEISWSPKDTSDAEGLEALLATPTRCVNARFRTINGSCNNLDNKQWGASGTPFQRFIQNAYEDGIEKPRGGFKPLPPPMGLPSPRKISANFHNQLSRIQPKLSNLFYQFGQFVAHDSGLTPEVDVGHGLSGFNNTACALDAFKNNKKCFNINVTGDPFYKDKLPEAVHDQLGFARTLPKGPAQQSKTSPREQINAGTSFLDASVVYGFNDKLSSTLRDHKTGKLIQGDNNRLPILKTSVSNPDLPSAHVELVAGGDPRTNMHPWLLTIQTLFFREHNRLADLIGTKCAVEKPKDENIFQNARRLLIAEFQNIIFTEFLPLVVGSGTMARFNLNLPTLHTGSTQYDKTTNPTTINGFQTAAMRFGHSMVQQGKLALQNITDGKNVGDGEPLKDEGLQFRYNYFNNTHYNKLESGKTLGNAEILGGLSVQPCQHFDRHLTTGVTNFLFDIKGLNNYGGDLASRNIQRGRDHGLPSYQTYRDAAELEVCGLKNGQDYDISQENWKLLQDIYGNEIKEKSRRGEGGVDLWTGGLAETPASDAVVGPLFQCLIGLQFQKFKSGDRFFFTHSEQVGGFRSKQKEEIRKRSMRDIICQNSQFPKEQKIRKHAMEIRDGEDLLPCDTEINRFDNVCDLII